MSSQGEDVVAVAPVTDHPVGDARAASPAAVPRRLLFAAGAVVAVVRWWVSHRREVFHLTPDEPGQLAIARYLGGAVRWNMLDRSTWRPGYGTLLAPVHWVTSDPLTVFRAALVLNAVLGGLACVVLCLLARRLTTMSPAACAVAGTAVALAPAVLLTSNWVWSESLVALVASATVLALLRFDERPSAARGVTLVALAAAGFAAHSRLLPLVAVAAGLVVVEAARRRLGMRLAALLVGGLLALTWLVSRWSAWLVERIWETPKPTNTVDGVLDRVTDPAGVAVAAVGQVWYQLVATAGLAGLGVIALVAAARHGRRQAAATGHSRRGHPAPAAARIVLVATGSVVALSMVFMADRLRPDQVVYGRYNDAVLGPVVVAGVGALVTMRAVTLRRSLVGVALVLVAALLVLEGWRGDALEAEGAVRSMVLGLQAFVGDGDTIDVTAITVWALVLLAAVAVAALVARTAGRGRWSWSLAVLVPLLLVGGVRAAGAVDGNLNTWALPEWSRRQLTEALPEGVDVRFRVVVSSQNPTAAWTEQRLRTMLYQFYLPTNALSVDGTGGSDGDGDGEGPYVFAPLGDPDLERAGARVVWRDPQVRIGLWVEPEVAASP